MECFVSEPLTSGATVHVHVCLFGLITCVVQVDLTFMCSSAVSKSKQLLADHSIGMNDLVQACLKHQSS